MRTITAAQQGVLDSGYQSEAVRLSIEDGAGNFREVDSYPGFNALEQLSWSGRVSDPHVNFDATLTRESYRLSLSPFMQASAINKGFDPAGSYSPLIRVGRGVRIEVNIAPMDHRGAGDWIKVFEGRIDSHSNKGKTVHIGGRAHLTGRLAQQQIQYERVYSFAADGGTAVACRIWEPEVDVVAGEYLVPATRGDDDPGFDKFFKCATSGTTGTEEPVWSTASNIPDGSAEWDYVGATTTAGNPVEEILQNLLDVNRLSNDPAITLATPASPAWSIRQFVQQRVFTLDAMLKLSTQIGWDLREKWNPATSQFDLVFYEPNRSSPSVDFSFLPKDYDEPEELSADLINLRNSVKIIYPDRTDLWPDGTPKRKEYKLQDPTAIAKYKQELWSEIQEDENSNLDSPTEVAAFAAAFISDCSEPDAVMSVALKRGFPWVELNDFYKFTAESTGPNFDNDLSLAVTGFRHDFSNKKLTTKLELRGKPTIGAKWHLERTTGPTRVRGTPPHRRQHFQGPRTPSATIESAVGGARIILDLDIDKGQLVEEYEHHFYRDSGTPLDATTLGTISKDRNVEATHLLPGVDYYHRVVQRHRNAEQLVRGQPSVEKLFTSGRASAGHIHEGIAIGDYPLNGGFETRRDPVGMPDHWTIDAGTLGTHFIVMEDGNGVSGGRYLRLVSRAVGDTGILSASLPVINEAGEADRYSQSYRLSFWIRNDAGNAAGTVELIGLNYYDYAGAFASASGYFLVDRAAKAGHWQRVERFLRVDASTDVRSMKLSVIANASSPSYTIDIDDLRLQHIGTPWYAFGDTSKYIETYDAIPGFANSWANYGSGYQEAQFRRDQFGEWWLRGTIGSGTLGNKFATMPEVAWGPAITSQVNESFGVFGRLRIDPNGDLVPVVGDTGGAAGSCRSFCLDGMHWSVRL